MFVTMHFQQQFLTLSLCAHLSILLKQQSRLVVMLISLALKLAKAHYLPLFSMPIQSICFGVFLRLRLPPCFRLFC